MLTEGCITKSEPLLICQPEALQTLIPSQSGKLPQFSVGYVQGMVRVTSLFQILVQAWKEK